MRKVFLSAASVVAVLALVCTSWAVMNVYDSNGNFAGSVNIEAGNLGKIEFSNSEGGGGGGDTQWGAYNGLCCNNGSALTFAVTIDGTTKSSQSNDCNGGSTWDGFASSTSGTKSLTFAFSGCASLDGSGSVSFESGKCYIVISDIEDSDVVIKYGEDTACAGPSSSGVSLKDRLEVSDTIRVFLSDRQLEALKRGN